MSILQTIKRILIICVIQHEKGMPMNDKSIKALNAFVDKIIEAVETRLAKKPQAGFSQAKVLKVDGDTAWVHIPGGYPETPVKKTINCKKGDTVQVRVGDDGAILVGNDTAPPTDDTAADKAQQTADEAVKAADNVKGLVDAISQFFWFLNGNSAEAGAHVTEIPEKSFLKNPRGGNLLLRSNSVRIRLGTQILSELSADRVSLASGKAVVKYSEDGSAFGLDDSHRIVVCKGTDEAGVRNDATLSSRDVTDFDMATMPMAFFNATHKVKNGTKHYAASVYAFDGEGGFWAMVLGKDGLLQNTGGFSIWAPGGLKKFSLDGYAVLEASVADHNDIFSHLSSLYSMETYALTLSSSPLAKGDHLEYSVTKTKQGYYPLCIAGFNIARQALTVRSCYIDEATEGSCKIHVHIRNDTGSASAGADIPANIMVLWIKMSA